MQNVSYTLPSSYIPENAEVNANSREFRGIYFYFVLESHNLNDER